MFLGLTAFLVIRMWFGKAIDDFNTAVKNQGSDGPALIATAGNGFTSTSHWCSCKEIVLTQLPVAWVGYSFLAVPLVCSLAKLHVTGGK